MVNIAAGLWQGIPWPRTRYYSLGYRAAERIMGEGPASSSMSECYWSPSL
jgi:hypothetical protein